MAEHPSVKRYDMSQRPAEERQRKIGLNETLFREVNERIAQLADRFNVGMLDAVCECGNPQCVDRLRIARADYAALRGDPLRFAVVPGHELLDVEHVVEQRQAYLVVVKTSGLAVQVARETDAS